MATPAAAPAKLVASSPAAPSMSQAQPKPQPVAVPAASASAPVVVRVPPTPRPPAPPPITWEKVWDHAVNFVVSGALLRGLLYLGAFMIVSSAVVLVVVYWNMFPTLVRLGFIAAVPLAFYAGGVLMRGRLKIPIAGTVFTGIGALLVAIDFVAVYQLGGLAGQLDVHLYWFIASLICTAVYAFTAWWLPVGFFGYVAGLGVGSTLWAFSTVVAAPYEWQAASIAASAAVLAGGAIGLRRAPAKWHELAQAARRLPHLILPVTLFVAVAVFLFLPADKSAGQAAICLFATVGYSLLAYHSRWKLSAYAAVWSSVGACLFGLKAVHLPLTWFATAGAVLAPLYILAGRQFREAGQKLPTHIATLLAGFGLLVIAAAAGLATLIADWWAGTIALAVCSVSLAWCAYFFRRPVLLGAAAAMFSLPLSLALGRWLVASHVGHWVPWLAAGWAALALIYLGVAATIRKLDRYGRYLALCAQGLTLLVLSCLFINFATPVDTWTAWPTLIGLAGAILVYFFSAILHDTDRHPALSMWVAWLPVSVNKAVFLWPVAALIPVWLAVFWYGPPVLFQPAWFGVVLALLALGYVGGGQVLARHKLEYRLPFLVSAYALIILAILSALGNAWALLTALYLSVGILGALIAIHRRLPETALAAVLFVWPFQLSLSLSPLLLHAHALAYALLSTFVYLPVGLWLQRNFPTQKAKGNIKTFSLAWAVYPVGYAIAAYAVASSLTLMVLPQGFGGLFWQSVPWIGAAVPLIITGQQLFGLYRFRRWPFAWAAVTIFLIAFGQTLTLMRIPAAYDAAAWAGLACLYLLAEYGLARLAWPPAPARPWLQFLRWPFVLWAQALAPLSLLILIASIAVNLVAWSAPATLAALGGVIVVYLLSAVLHDTGQHPALSVWANWLPPSVGRALFLWPVAVLLPVWLAAFWYAPPGLFQPAWLGVALAVLALGYVGLGQALARHKAEYRLPFCACAYPLIVVATISALGNAWALLTTLYVSVVALAALAAIYRRLVETALAAVLFLWPFQLSLNLSPLLPHAHALMYALLSTFAYLPLGLWLQRIFPTEKTKRRIKTPSLAWAIYPVGYAIAAYAIANSVAYLVLPRLLAPFGIQWLFVPWITAAVPLIITGQQLFSIYRFGRWPFAWSAAAVFLIAFGGALTLLQVPFAYAAAAWAGLAYGYLLAERGLKRLLQQPLPTLKWMHWLRWPLGVGAVLLGVLSLALTLPDATWVFSQLRSTHSLLPAICAQVLVVGLTVLAASAYRSRWPLYLEPWLAAVPVTLFFADYGERFFGQPLSSAQWGLVWMSLAGLQLLAAAALDRARERYSYGLFLGGYLLSLIVVAWALTDQLTLLWTLGIAVGFALVSHIWAYFEHHHALEDLIKLSRVRAVAEALLRTAFLFLAVYTFPVWLSQWLIHMGVSTAWCGAAFTLLAPVYLATGLLVKRLKSYQAQKMVQTWPLYSAAYALGMIGVGMALSDPAARICALAVDAMMYAASAYIFRQAFWLYGASILAPIVVVLTLNYNGRMTPSMVAGSFVALAFIYFLSGWWFNRQRLCPWPLPLKKERMRGISPYALPFFIPGCALSLVALVVAYASANLMLAVCLAEMALYALSTWTFRRAAFLYPTLLLAHGALLAYLSTFKGGAFYQASLPFHLLTWVVALMGYGFGRYNQRTAAKLISAGATDDVASQVAAERSRKRVVSSPGLNALLAPSWAQPFFIFAVLDIVIWQEVALGSYGTTLALAAGHALLLGFLATAWQDGVLPYGALGFFLLAAGAQLVGGGASVAALLAWFSGIGFGLYVLEMGAEALLKPIQGREQIAERLKLWLSPLRNAAVALTALALLSIVSVINHLVPCAFTLAFAGALYLTLAYRGKYHRLGYLGMALLEVAWALLLISRAVAEPQWYAIPAGIYFAAVGVLESRQGRKRFSRLVESFGLAVMLVTTFAQSLQRDSGTLYFAWLIAEGLLVVWWGAARRVRVPFFIGLGASVLNILSQLVLLATGNSALLSWIIIGGVGVFIVIVAVFIERQRVLLLAKAKAFAAELETWE